MDIYDNATSNLLTTTDWLDGPAELYCIKTIKEKDSHSTWFGGFLPNHEYTAVLTVRNEDDVEDSFTLEFTTPETNCYVAENNFVVIPNPITTNPIIFRYTLPYPANVNVFGSHSVHGMYSGLLGTFSNQSAGTHDLNINASNWYSGTNYIIIQIRDEVYSTAIAKL